MICGILAQPATCDDRIFHTILWSIHKQKRVSYSSFGDEILAGANADDLGFDLKLLYDAIFTRNKMRYDVYLDYRGLFDTITTICEPR